MTQEERRNERDYKQQVVTELQANLDGYLADYAYALEDTDKRLRQYVIDVISNPDDHNLYELLKIRRYFQMLDRWEWKAKRVQKKIRLYEKLRFSGTTG